MRTLLVLACVLAAALAADSLDLNDKNWVKYKKRNQLTFANQAEELENLKNFLQFQKVVSEINSKGKLPKEQTRLFPGFIERYINGLHGQLERNEKNGKSETRGISHILDQAHKLALDLHGRRTRSADQGIDESETRGFGTQLKGLYYDLHGRRTRSLDGPTGKPVKPETRGLSHFAQQMHGLYLDLHGRATRSLINHVNTNKTLPASVDWREKNVVSPVQDQGNCGGGWAFAAAGALEAQVAIKTGKLVPLSPQSLIDCSKKNQGCDGGSPVLAASKPIQSLASYPYTGLAGACKAGPTAAQSTDFIPIESGNEVDLQDAIANVGPVTVAIDATDPLLQVYKKGVYVPKNCNSALLSHVALAVGYGQEDGQDYWLIKNSWGPEWGEKGYLKLAKTGQNTCGIASHAGYLLA